MVWYGSSARMDATSSARAEPSPYMQGIEFKMTYVQARRVLPGRAGLFVFDLSAPRGYSYPLFSAALKRTKSEKI